MAILKLDQLLANIKEKIGEDTSDEAIQLIEDVTDTINDYESKTKDTTKWEEKYKENDAAWRKKYRDRFFGGTDKPDEPEKPDDIDDIDVDPNSKLTYEKLFKEGDK